jgi:hypothetical protein
MHSHVAFSTKLPSNPTKKSKVSFSIMPKMRPTETDGILASYQEKYQAEDKAPIVTQHQGETSTCNLIANTFHQPSPSGGEPKYPSRQQLLRNCHMKPKNNMNFMVDDPNLDDVVLFLLNKERRTLLSEHDWSALACIDKDYNELVATTRELVNVDFSPLKEPRLNFEDQSEIQEERVKMADACLLHYAGEIGMLVRYCGGEFTAAHRDVEQILNDVREYIPTRDLNDMERILREGCPFSIDKRFSKSNKMKLLKQGNQKSVEENKKAVIKTMNKEDRNSHLISVSSIFCRFSAFCHHVPQGMNMKKPESPRIVWDGTNKKDATDEVMNEDVDMSNEPTITFGNTKREFMIRMYNTRISYPSQEIWIGAADIKACFRWPRIHPDACGAFSLQLRHWFHESSICYNVYGVWLHSKCKLLGTLQTSHRNHDCSLIFTNRNRIYIASRVHRHAGVR